MPQTRPADHNPISRLSLNCHPPAHVRPHPETALALLAELQDAAVPAPATVAPPMEDEVFPRWERIDDMRTPGRSQLVTAGPGRMNGAAMHGLYRRPVAPSTDEVAAYWQGYLLWHWQEAKTAHPLPGTALLSAWNLILAEGLSQPDELTPYGSNVEQFTNAWKSRAVLAGYLPYANFRLPTEQVSAWCATAERARLHYDREPDAVRGYQRIIAARPQTYGQLFDLHAIGLAYASAGLPSLVAASQLAALREHRDIPIATYASVELPLEQAPLVIQGLTLGHPVTMTLMHAWDALPVIPIRTPSWRAGETAAAAWPGLRTCDHTGRHEGLDRLDAERGGDLVAFVRDYYHSEFSPQGRPASLDDLIERPYLVPMAYRRYLATFTPARPAISGQLHRLICCLLRAMATKGGELPANPYLLPENLHLEAKMGRSWRSV